MQQLFLTWTISKIAVTNTLRLFTVDSKCIIYIAEQGYICLHSITTASRTLSIFRRCVIAWSFLKKFQMITSKILWPFHIYTINVCNKYLDMVMPRSRLSARTPQNNASLLRMVQVNYILDFVYAGLCRKLHYNLRRNSNRTIHRQLQYNTI